MTISFDDIVVAARTGNTALLQQCTPDDVVHIDINKQIENQNTFFNHSTVLLTAVKNGYSTVILELHRLFGDKVDCNATEFQNDNALMIGATHGHADCITTLYNTYGNKINHKNVNGC